MSYFKATMHQIQFQLGFSCTRIELTTGDNVEVKLNES